MDMRDAGVLRALPVLLFLSASACRSSGSPTDFTTLEPGAPGAGGPRVTGGAATGAGGTFGPAADSAGLAPAGRTGAVQEADIYKLSGTRLFYLNTYRGFIVYDVTDPKQPVKVSRLPVYGYPVEMFVDGNTVYALLRDALYLSEASGKLQFQRHNVSQLVTIDVSDVANPRVLKTLDIIGELHEGVSRKIDGTIYVVSEQWGGYSWGWPGVDAANQDQAWVYSYDVSDPQNPRQVGQLPIFQGGGYSTNDPATGAYAARTFNGVAISATSNALMVVENWYTYASDNSSPCSWSNSQDAVVSIIDVSDPTGVIRPYTRFQTQGSLDDQFKMTYRFDDATGRATFYGIFGRQSWGCSAGPVTQNSLESWDVTDGANPRRLAGLDFGEPGEAVRATAYDLSRNVVYAVTARQIDPLYAIDIADPAAPRVLSAIEGLSGSFSVFRSVGGGQFLLGVGQDTSTTCTGFQNADPTWHESNMAVTIVDVRDLSSIRLVQRQCVAIQNAEWSWSSVNWNLDQAHKMLGMFQDGDTNIITVPISYYTQQNLDVGWWYQWKTAVGLLTWDLSRYDDTKAPADQNVVQTYGTFVHPQGEVMRSILFRHPVTGDRTMINISDTHLSVASIADLTQPQLQSVVEVAPPVDEIYGFGDYLVERVDIGGYWSSSAVAEFRVKRAGGPVDDQQPVATFQIGQVGPVYRYKQNLVVMRTVVDPAGLAAPTNEAVVYDLGDPTHPRQASRTTVPFSSYFYYGFYCGVGFWGGYWFGDGARTIVTATGLVQVVTNWANDASGNWTSTTQLVLLDLRDPTSPSVVQAALPDAQDWWQRTLVDDPAVPSGFYLAHRDVVAQVTMDDGTMFTRYRYFAQRWESADGRLVAGADINLPGPLARTWRDGFGSRLFLTRDSVYRTIAFPDHTEWHADTRLNFLRQADGHALLLDARTFADVGLSSLVVDGTRLFVAAQNQYYWWGYAAEMSADPPTWESTSDRLIALDLSRGTLATVYDQPMRTYGVQLMGMHQGDLFISLPGDGVLVADVSDAAHPVGTRFLRTLGWANHIEFARDDAYVASGNFGVFDLNLRAPAAIPQD
jgi:hypothetical protein